MDTCNKKELATRLGLINPSERINYEALQNLFIEKGVLEKLNMTAEQYSRTRRRFTKQETEIIKDLFLIKAA